MPTPKVSVIVPVYNAEEHLQQCMDSILAQTLSDIEVICVDDGSTDGSAEMLDDYARRDSRVVVLRQENSYAGVARNNGMARAQGKYLVFWDADDFFKPEALEKMYDQCEGYQAELCVCGASRYYTTLDKEVAVSGYIKEGYLPEAMPFSRKTNEEYILNFGNAVVWNKMFLRDFVERERLAFQPVRNGNDTFFVGCALCLAESIVVVPECLVCYRTMQQSGLVSSLSKSPVSPVKAWVDVRWELERRGVFPRDSFMRKAASSVFYNLANMPDWESFSELMAFLKGGGLDDLLLSDLRDDGFYLEEWHRPYLELLLNGTPEEFLARFAYLSYCNARNANAQKAVLRAHVSDLRSRVGKLREQLERVRTHRDKILSSTSYRVGFAITKPIRKIKEK